MPLQSLHTARDRSSAERIAAARRLALDALYEAWDRSPVGAPAPMDLEVLEKRAVRDAELGCGGRAVTTVLGSGRGGAVEERLTILVSRTRADRVRAAVYTVRVGEALTYEEQVRAHSGLFRLAVHVAAHA